MADVTQPRRRRSRGQALVAVVGVVLFFLLALPWPQGTPEPMVLGFIPAPLFFWMLWTALFVGYVAWIAVVRDPYRSVVLSNLGEDAAGIDTEER